MSSTVTAGPEGLLIIWENDAETAHLHPDDTLVVMARAEETGDGEFNIMSVLYLQE